MIPRARYNPAFISDQALVDGFAVRKDVFEALLGSVRRNTGPANEHVLLIGGRGAGKTTLLRRVGVEVRRDPELARRWFPLFYPEESYEVGTAGEFWLEALLHLGDTTGDPTWTAEWESARQIADDDRLAARALAAIRRFQELDGRRILLFIENLDMLSAQLSERDSAAIRKVLQGAPWLMLMASAVRRFPGVDQPDQPMFDLFRRVQLEPLDAVDVDALWARVSRTSIGVQRAEAIRILTGGNPRMVVLLSSFARKHTLADLLADLASLIDEHTDYFKDNIEALDGQNRRMFLAAASIWRPATVKEISAEARIDARLGSTLLSRLLEQGRVEIIGKQGKNNLYQVSERLYNIYYLMRRRGGPDQRVRAVVDFMRHYYEPVDLPPVISTIAGAACIASPTGWRAEHMRTVGSVLGHAAIDRTALDAALGALPEELFEQEDRPEELKKLERSAEGLPALLARPDGTRHVPAASRIVAAAAGRLRRDRLSVVSPAVARTAKALLFTPGVGPKQAFDAVAVAGADADIGAYEELEAKGLGHLPELPTLSLKYLQLAFRLEYVSRRPSRPTPDVLEWAAGSPPYLPGEATADEIRFVLAGAARHLRPAALALLAAHLAGGTETARMVSFALDVLEREFLLEHLPAALVRHSSDTSLVQRGLLYLAAAGRLGVAVALASVELRLLDHLMRNDTDGAWALVSPVVDGGAAGAELLADASMLAHLTHRTEGARRLAARLFTEHPDHVATWAVLAKVAPDVLHNRLVAGARLNDEALLDVMTWIDRAEPLLIEPGYSLLARDDRRNVRSALGRVLGLNGDGAGALSAFLPLLTDPDAVSADPNAARDTCLSLATMGVVKPLFDALTNGPTALALAPVVAALALLSGEEPVVAAEVLAVGRALADQVVRQRVEGGTWARPASAPCFVPQSTEPVGTLESKHPPPP